MNSKKNSNLLSSLIIAGLVSNTMTTCSFAGNFERDIVNKTESNYKNNYFRISIAKMIKSEIIDIQDKILLKQINKELKKGEDEPVTKTELESLTSLSIENSELTSLEGLQYAINLKDFSLYGYNDTKFDISPIKSMTKLEKLELSDVDFSGSNDIFKNFKNLNNLYLCRAVNLEDLSYISELENLMVFSLHRTNLNDKILNTLNTMKNLTTLDLWQNSGIVKLDFIKKFPSLTTFEISSAEYIKDISPVLELDKLEELSFRGLKLNDYSLLENLENLKKLHLDDCMISDISFVEKLSNNLVELSLYDNNIQDISALSNCANLTNLTELDLSYNFIQDISALSTFKNLKSVNISSNYIDSVEPLRDLDMSVILHYNRISDFTPLVSPTHSYKQEVFVTATNNSGVIEFENPLKTNKGTFITDFEFYKYLKEESTVEGEVSAKGGKIVISNISNSPDFLVLSYDYDEDGRTYSGDIIVNLLPEQDDELNVDISFLGTNKKEWENQYLNVRVSASSNYPIRIGENSTNWGVTPWVNTSNTVTHAPIEDKIQNGKYGIIVENTKGDIFIKYAEINNIDYTPPEIDIKVTSGKDDKSNVINVKASDDLSGIEKIVLPTNEEHSTSEVTMESILTGELTFKAYDNAGNVTEKTILIGNLGEEDNTTPEEDNSGGQGTPPAVDDDENIPSIPPEEDSEDENDTENNNPSIPGDDDLNKPSTPDNNPQLPPNTDEDEKEDEKEDDKEDEGEDINPPSSNEDDEIINSYPTINFKNVINIIVGSSFNPLNGVTAFDEEDGDLTNNIRILENNVNINEIGEYYVQLVVTDKGNYTTFANIKVNVLDKEYKPTLSLESEKITLTIGDNLNPLEYIKANDKTDGDISSIIGITYNNVDVNKPGLYTIRYKVTNSLGIDAEKELTVEVRDNNQDNNNNNNNNNNSNNNSTNTNDNDNTITGKPQTGDSSAVGYVAGAGLSALALWLLNRNKKKNTTDKDVQ